LNATEVAFDEVHVRVAVDPAFTVDGFTRTLMLAGEGITVTFTEALTAPPGPVAVAV
jgi:hypothetical protein